MRLWKVIFTLLVNVLEGVTHLEIVSIGFKATTEPLPNKWEIDILHI